jgi:hypothetical protein
MQLSLAHRALQAEQQPIIEVRGIVRGHILVPLFGCQQGGWNR